jgi:exodeoxyribonuclease III
MLIITWNCNSIRARLPRLLELLETHQPDVVCLQETKVAAEGFPHLELALAGYSAIDHSSGTWNGVAVLVPTDVDASGAVFGLPGEPRPEEARWLEVVVRGVRVITVYVPNGRTPGHPRFEEKLRFLDVAAERVGALAAASPLVVSGDINVAPTDADVWNPGRRTNRTHVTPEERERVAALLQKGVRDAWLEAGEGGRYTWWSNHPTALVQDRGMRIDLTLVSDHLHVRRCQVARVFREGARPSDHAPLLTWLDLEPSPA